MVATLRIDLEDDETLEEALLRLYGDEVGIRAALDRYDRIEVFRDGVSAGAFERGPAG